eukprot:ANDGO_05357.mRNA.1 Putative SWI/SNF-related matrix-associated actin-dependent regulator of chromatin subfamily A member 3-like 2
MPPRPRFEKTNAKGAVIRSAPPQEEDGSDDDPIIVSSQRSTQPTPPLPPSSSSYSSQDALQTSKNAASSSSSLSSGGGFGEALSQSILHYNPYIGNLQSSLGDSAAQDEDPETVVGSIKGNIVGIKYYVGEVNDGELVSLIREPFNAYDRNSIRVDNIGGRKVGHVPKDLAALLAPYVDSKEISITGYVEKRGGNMYTIPLEITVYAEPAKHERVKKILPIGKYVAPWSLYPETVPGGYTAGSYSRVSSQHRSQMIAAEYAKAAKESRAKEMERRKQLSDISSTFDSRFLGTMLDGGELPRIAKPEGILTSLFPHQEQALAWMLQKEQDAFTRLGPEKKSHFFWQFHDRGGVPMYHNVLTRFTTNVHPTFPGGGLLCDDMGLGKTLSLLSLLVSQKGKGTTLIVCPTSLVSEWIDQIDEHVQPGLLQVHVYYTPASRQVDIIRNADVVVTTYSILREEFSACCKNDDEPCSKMMKPAEGEKAGPIKSGSLKGLFVPGLFYRVICDEAQAVKNHKSKVSTAVSALDARQRFMVTGSPISNNMSELFALFKAIRAEPFDRFDLWRSIIQQPLRSTSLSDMEEGYRRLQVLVKGLCLRRVKQRPSEVHSTQSPNAGTVLLPELAVKQRVVDLSQIENALYHNIERGSQRMVEKMQANGVAMKSMGHVLSLLCRIRQACCHPYMVLSSRTDSELIAADVQQSMVEAVEGTDRESAAAEVIPDGMNRQRLKKTFGIHAGVASTVRTASPASASQDILAPSQSVASSQETASIVEGEHQEPQECPVCFCELSEESAYVTPCAHAFCRECITMSLTVRPTCPLCREPCEAKNVRSLSEVRQRLLSADEGASFDAAMEIPAWLQGKDVTFMSSSKINALIEDITTKMLLDQKIIVFSQWTTFLELIQKAFLIAGIPFVTLTGSMSRSDRQASVKAFQNTPATQCKAFLISLRAGGFGLNLTAASHVAMMDPFFNSAVELQAIDRAWRIGNVSDIVTVWRYVARGTVEERVLKMQAAKNFLLQSAFGDTAASIRESAVQLAKLKMQAVFLMLGSSSSHARDIV